MAQENNTAREQTELEKLSQDALNQARRERKMSQDTCIAELAQCDTEIPEALEKQVQAEIASLQQARENLSSAHKIASSTVDELSARAADVAKSLNRKWYRINPPSLPVTSSHTLQQAVCCTHFRVQNIKIDIQTGFNDLRGDPDPRFIRF